MRPGAQEHGCLGRFPPYSLVYKPQAPQPEPQALPPKPEAANPENPHAQHSITGRRGGSTAFVEPEKSPSPEKDRTLANQQRLRN